MKQLLFVCIAFAISLSLEAQDTDQLEYSGLIKLNTEIPFELSETDSQDIGILSISDRKLIIKKAYISFFNNKASTIVLEGHVIGDPSAEVIVVNNQFSIPLRYFNTGKNYVPFELDGNTYRVNYNDVFDYKADQHFNYSIANDDIRLTDSLPTAQVAQRRFFDFFTAVIFTDLLGFEGSNNNTLVNAQAKLLLPINQRNIRKNNFFRQLITEVNIALYNSFEGDNQFINVVDDATFNHFDLLKKSNLNGKLNLEVYAHEAKGFFSYISLGYNASFYRTGIRFTDTNLDAEDNTFSTQIFSLSHGPQFNIEIRPQTNFGADVGFSFEHFTYNDSEIIADRTIDNIMVDNRSEDLGFKYNIINAKADFYWLTSPGKSKGGIFARLGGFYHVVNDNIYPQIMVGYATNLTSFVNRFKAKK